MRSVLEIVVTALPLAFLWTAGWCLLDRGRWWAIVLCVPAAAFVVRLFLIQHDCGHGSLFKNTAANDWVGRIIGVITLTPYSHWRDSHGVHHATSGNLDRREMGAVDTLTIEEYAALTPWRRWLYRIYRHPLVLFGLGPAFLFFVQQRLPIGFMRAGTETWLGVMGDERWHRRFHRYRHLHFWLSAVFRDFYYDHSSQRDCTASVREDLMGASGAMESA
jgi:omega-6 fatty acid desaturase (delta-12 desaturase)